jgi:hypothetical protein
MIPSHPQQPTSGAGRPSSFEASSAPLAAERHGGEPTHTLTFADFFEAMDGLAFLVRNGYRELKGSLERLVPKSVRVVAGKSLGLRRGTFVLVWSNRFVTAEARFCGIGPPYGIGGQLRGLGGVGA